MRLSGGSDRIANIFPYQGMSIRNRKRNIAHTDLSASMEHQGGTEILTPGLKFQPRDDRAPLLGNLPLAH